MVKMDTTDVESTETEAVKLVEHDDMEELVPKRGAVSVVWRFFGYKKSDGQPNNGFLQMLLG